MSNLNYSYRFLETKDFDQFINLHRSKSVFMKKTMTELEQKEYLDRLAWLFTQDDYKVTGCFDGDKLVAQAAGRFFKTHGMWYNHGQSFNLGDKTLNQGMLWLQVHFQLGTLLMHYAESIGLFQVYQARELHHGLAEFKYYDHQLKRGTLPFEFRYIPLMDKIYMPGDTDILEIHKFFFKPDNIVKVPTLISLMVLKQEHRKQQVLKKIVN